MLPYFPEDKPHSDLLSRSTDILPVYQFDHRSINRTDFFLGELLVFKERLILRKILYITARPESDANADFSIHMDPVFVWIHVLFERFPSKSDDTFTGTVEPR